MKISRHGSSADHGRSSVDFKEPVFKWNSSNSCLIIGEDYVEDFSSRARHNYTIEISFSELNKLIGTLSAAALDHAEVFEKELEPSLKALLRLQWVVSGLNMLAGPSATT